VCFCLKFKGIYSLFEKTLEKKIEKKEGNPKPSAAAVAARPSRKPLAALPRTAQLPKPQPVSHPTRTVSQRPSRAPYPSPSLFSVTAGALLSTR